MKLTRFTDYSLRVLIYLGLKDEGRVTIKEISDAYNISLGERRAESVAMFLGSAGIDTKRLNTVSHGEERPIAVGNDEVSWAENRRAQFVIN